MADGRLCPLVSAPRFLALGHLLQVYSAVVQPVRLHVADLCRGKRRRAGKSTRPQAQVTRFPDVHDEVALTEASLAPCSQAAAVPPFGALRPRPCSLSIQSGVTPRRPCVLHSDCWHWAKTIFSKHPTTSQVHLSQGTATVPRQLLAGPRHLQLCQTSQLPTGDPQLSLIAFYACCTPQCMRAQQMMHPQWTVFFLAQLAVSLRRRWHAGRRKPRHSGSKGILEFLE